MIQVKSKVLYFITFYDMNDCLLSEHKLYISQNKLVQL